LAGWLPPPAPAPAVREDVNVLFPEMTEMEEIQKKVLTDAGFTM